MRDRERAREGEREGEEEGKEEEIDGSALNGDSRECPVNAAADNSTHQRQR